MIDSIILTFVVCLMHAPMSCETRSLDAPFSTPVACLMAGQTEAARWIHDHPAYRLDSWRCGRAEEKI